MQLFICDPYPAPMAKFEVREVHGVSLERTPRFVPGCVEDWSLVDQTTDYEVAAALAREHCVAYGVAVWVVDCNDGDFIALRVTPEEYSRVRPSAVCA